MTNARIPNLLNLLTKDTILTKVSATDWKDVIRKAGQLLLDVDAIEPRYVDAMIDFCEKYKAYIVIEPGVALPHARPEDGVKRISLCLLTLKKPIYFGHPHNDPVDLVIALGAVDSESHIKALGQLAEILMNQKILKGIREARTKKNVLELIKEKQQNKNKEE